MPVCCEFHRQRDFFCLTHISNLMKKIFRYLSVFATALTMMTMASCSNDTFDEIQPDSSVNPVTRSTGDESKIQVPELSAETQGNSAGVLVLNEGNMTSQNGFLNYLDKDRYYNTVVGGTRLGNVCQDLYINNGYVYVVAQNTKPLDAGSGIIYKLNASNFETVATYPTQFSSSVYANNPTHIAVYNDNAIYVRGSGSKYDGTGTGYGVYRYNPSTNTAQRLNDQSKVVSAAPMVIAGNYLYVSYSDKVRVYEANTTNLDTVATFGVSPKGLVKSTDGRYVYAYSSTGIYTVETPVDPLRASETTVTLNLQSLCNSAIMSYYNGYLYFINTADDNKLAYYNTSTGAVTTTNIAIFNEIDFEAGEEIYNGVAVDPATGYLYVATTTWGAAYKTNTALNVFQIGANNAITFVTSVLGYERFTAGIFFPQNFGATVGTAAFQTKIVADPTDDK